MSIKGDWVKLAKGWNIFGKIAAYCNGLFQLIQRSVTWTTWDSEGVFSAFLFYLYLLCILVAVFFTYITQNSSMRCSNFLYIWIGCVYSCFIYVCPTSRNSEQTQLPCQVTHWITKSFYYISQCIHTNIIFNLHSLGWRCYLRRLFDCKDIGVSDIYSNNTTFLHLIFLLYFNEFLSYILKVFLQCLNSYYSELMTIHALNSFKY